MKNKKFWLGMLVLTLVFGMTVFGCGDDTPEPDTNPSPPQPGEYGNPIDRVESIALGTMTSSTSGWQQLLLSIESTKKYINLDLSACTMTGTSFNPVSSVEAGKRYIVSIILPTVATSIEAGASGYYDSTFKNFSSLKSISGANIITIGDYSGLSVGLESADFPKATTIGKQAFYHSGLENASFPLVTTIGEGAFSNSNRMVALNIPKVTNIGSNAFADMGYNNALTITMGSTAPSLGFGIFSSIDKTIKVKVKVPFGASGYTPFTDGSVSVYGADSTANWANGLRGGGWNGSTLTDASKINQNITLTIERQ
jgi:hypothetical protein